MTTRQGYGITKPPSTGTVTPDIYEDATLTSQINVDANSSGSPIRCAAMHLKHA